MCGLGVGLRDDGSHKVPSHLRSIRAISTIESMEIRAYDFKRSPKYDMDAYIANTFWRWGLELVLKVGSSKKLG